MNQTVINCLILVLIFNIFFVVQRMAFKDEVRQQLAYCENVKDGTWPDYKETYKTECTQDRIEKFENFLR